MTPASRSDGLQSRGLKISAAVKTSFLISTTFYKIRCLLLQSETWLLVQVDPRRQVPLKLMVISASMFVTSLINKHNHMYFGNNGHWTFYFEMDTEFLMSWRECDPEVTFFLGFHTDNDSVFIQPLCMRASRCHYSEWFATASHSGLYFFFHHEVIFFVRTFST